MREIGVRELKETLSEVLRAVGRGDHVRVTSRGRPVADIVPAGEVAPDDHLRGLVMQGRLVMPARARPTRAPRLATARKSASAVILAERDLEP